MKPTERKTESREENVLSTILFEILNLAVLETSPIHWIFRSVSQYMIMMMKIKSAEAGRTGAVVCCPTSPLD